METASIQVNSTKPEKIKPLLKEAGLEQNRDYKLTHNPSKVFPTLTIPAENRFGLEPTEINGLYHIRNYLEANAERLRRNG